MFAQYITKDDFQFQMLTTVTSSTSQINRLGSKWSRHLAEQADVDPSLAAVADYLVFGQAQAQAQARAWARAMGTGTDMGRKGPERANPTKGSSAARPKTPKMLKKAFILIQAHKTSKTLQKLMQLLVTL